MTSMVLTTARLRLVAATPALLRAEGEGRARFAALLNARVPESWPPELYDEDARLYTLAELEACPDHGGWTMYYVLRARDNGDAEAIGVAGYKGPPGEDGSVEVGYGILPEHRRRGYATEATRALVNRAFADPRVRRVTTETYPHLAPSIGVMAKIGFTLQGPGSEEGVVRYHLPRERWRGCSAGG